MKKILFITQAVGGVETSLLLIFKFLSREQYELHLICPPGTNLASAAASYGVRVHTVKIERNPHILRDLWSLIIIVRILKKGGYHLVHAQSAKGGLLARLATQVVRVNKVIYSPRAFSYMSQRRLLYQVFLSLERLTARFTDVLIAASDSEKVRAISEVHYDKSRVVVVPNSVDPDVFFSIQRADEPPGEKTVLTIGRLGYQKNPMMFLDLVECICAHRGDINFVMQGGGFLGHLENRVVQRIQRSVILRTYCKLLPWSENGSLRKIYEQCSVFVLTSLFEGMPNTILEAMMYGIPVVATDVDGSRDLVVHGVTGFLVSTAETETMARHVSSLVDDRELWTKMSNAARLRIRQHYLAPVNIRRLEKIYDEDRISNNVPSISKDFQQEELAPDTGFHQIYCGKH